ncbi:MAG TPA: BlaI/MecI/CopY family transcriptional regulator [Asanoa sp.]|jgi:predicted transcriptional regulator|nr:BlaI/MecI/CopY family transcriptional regulator [Asanoa sp.]
MAVNAGAGRRPHGALEAEILAALGAADGPLSASEVQRALGHDLAYNTVQTILIRLLEKDAVQRRARGRGHVYWVKHEEASEAARRMRATLAGRPDRSAVLQRFAAELDDDDARTLRALLAEPPEAP